MQIDAADLSEHTVLAPTNPYSASKAAAEMYVTAYASSFQLPAIMIRLNNVYGPHQVSKTAIHEFASKADSLPVSREFVVFTEDADIQADRLAEIVPKFINLLQRKKPLWIHGDGNNTRRYLYAGDAADAFDTILHKGEIGQIYNVDSRDEISNLDLAGKLLGRFGVTDIAGAIQHARDRPFNDLRYAVDGAELRKLGWKPQVSFEQGLTNTVEWYGKFSDWWGPIDNILTPFPVVKGEESGDVNASDDVAKTGAPEGSSQAGSGAEDRTTLGVEAVKLKNVQGVNDLLGTNGANGSADRARKRKFADVMDEDSVIQ